LAVRTSSAALAAFAALGAVIAVRSSFVDIGHVLSLCETISNFQKST
jgi:hypothetical protein